MSGLASISVDLDSLPHYCRIHGLPETLLDDRARRLVYQVAIPRFLRLFERLGVAGTFFAVGDDLEDAGNVAQLRRAHQAGVEIGNHTYSHDYAVSRRPKAEIDAEVARGEERISEAVGERPRGFRAPGYTLSPDLYSVLCERGYLYDSSTFPAVPYYAAKAAVMGALKVAGRPSKAILDSPRVLGAPRQPYRPDPKDPYSRGEGPVIELPIAVAPLTRIPFIGTLVATVPSAILRPGYLSLRGEPHLNFELHGVDVLGFDDGLPGPLLRQQRDLRVHSSTKMARLDRVFGWIRRDFDVVTLAQAARAFPNLP